MSLDFEDKGQALLLHLMSDNVTSTPLKDSITDKMDVTGNQEHEKLHVSLFTSTPKDRQSPTNQGNIIRENQEPQSRPVSLLVPM